MRNTGKHSLHWVLVVILECSIHIPQAYILHVFSSLYCLSCYYIFCILLMHRGGVVYFLNCWQTPFFFPPKKFFAKQGKTDYPVIPCGHISFRSSDCFPLLVINPGTIAKAVNHIRINCKIATAIIFSLALPRNKSKKL